MSSAEHSIHVETDAGSFMFRSQSTAVSLSRRSLTGNETASQVTGATVADIEVRTYWVRYGFQLPPQTGLPPMCGSCVQQRSEIPGIKEGRNPVTCDHMEFFQAGTRWTQGGQGNDYSADVFAICWGPRLIGFAPDQAGVARFQRLRPDLTWTAQSLVPIDVRNTTWLPWTETDIKEEPTD